MLLDKKAARAHMRKLLRARNIIAEVTDVNPLAHDRYFLFQGKCLWCKDAAQAVVYKGTYCRQAVEVPPKTFTLTSVHEHNLADAPADTARTFEPLMEQAAKRYVAEHTEWSAKGLTKSVCLSLSAASVGFRTTSRRQVLKVVSRFHRAKRFLSAACRSGPRRRVTARRSLPGQYADSQAGLHGARLGCADLQCAGEGQAAPHISGAERWALGAGQCVHYAHAALTASHDQR